MALDGGVYCGKARVFKQLSVECLDRFHEELGEEFVGGLQNMKSCSVILDASGVKVEVECLKDLLDIRVIGVGVKFEYVFD